MHAYDARQQFIDGLEQYIAGIETDDGLLRLSENVCTYHDPLPPEGARSSRQSSVTPTKL